MGGRITPRFAQEIALSCILSTGRVFRQHFLGNIPHFLRHCVAYFHLSSKMKYDISITDVQKVNRTSLVLKSGWIPAYYPPNSEWRPMGKQRKGKAGEERY